MFDDTSGSKCVVSDLDITWTRLFDDTSGSKDVVSDMDKTLVTDAVVVYVKIN